MGKSDLTKKELAETLKKLMAKKSLDKITIHELTEVCGISRSSFYYQFEDVYALLKWTLEQDAISLVARHGDMLRWQEGALQLFRYLDENRAVVLCALNSVGHRHLKRLLYDDVYDLLRSYVNAYGSKIDNESVSSDYKDFLTRFYAEALTGLLESWVLGELKRAPEELIAMVERTLDDQVRGARARTEES